MSVHFYADAFLVNWTTSYSEVVNMRSRNGLPAPSCDRRKAQKWNAHISFLQQCMTATVWRSQMDDFYIQIEHHATWMYLRLCAPLEDILQANVVTAVYVGAKAIVSIAQPYAILGGALLQNTCSDNYLKQKVPYL